MTPKDWVAGISAMAWPFVGLLALLYIWRSDAIAKLIQISESMKDLKSKLAEVVEVQQKLELMNEKFSQIVTDFNESIKDLGELRADVENISAQMITIPEHNSLENTSNNLSYEAPKKFTKMNEKWEELTNLIVDKFGYVDKRSVAGDVYRFTHRNRKGAIMPRDLAEDIAQLHSSMKSYRRRKSYVESWLDDDTYREFIEQCEMAILEVRDIRTDREYLAA